MKYLLIVLAIASTAASCGIVDSEPIVCTMEARPALVVDVVADGEAVDAALVVARDGAFADSAYTMDGRASLAHEREGEYTVTVERAGFATWQADDIRVRADECHVKTVEIEAVLEQN